MDNFEGGRLRLDAFLRILENLPPQTPRKRRRTAAQVAQIPSHHVASPPENWKDFNAPAPSSSDDYVIPVYKDVEAENSHAAPTKQKSPVKYTSARPKADLRRPEHSSTARKRRPPLDELVLVRTLPADGLPDRSAQRKQTEGIADVDPIEDSQIDPYDHTFQSGRGHRCVRRITYSTTSSVRQNPSPTDSSANRHSKASRFQKPKPVKARTYIPAKFADGFTDRELTIPPKVKKKVPKRTTKLTLPFMTAGLVLCSGLLPVVGSLCEPPLCRASTLPTDLTMCPETMEDHEDESPALQVQSTKSSQYENSKKRMRMTDEERIALQLSRVTAPTRHGLDDSDSEQTDDEEDTVMNDSDGSIFSQEPDDNEQLFDLAQEAAVYADDTDYGPASWRSTDGDQNIWSHYGGME